MANLDYNHGSRTTRIVLDSASSGAFSLSDGRLYCTPGNITDIIHDLGGGNERSAGDNAGQDGAMKNPVPSGTARGYDNRSGNYQYSAAVDAVAGGFPITMAAGDVLVISEASDLTLTHNPTAGGPTYLPLQTAIVLHCVASAPAATDFAPPYCGTKTIRAWSADLLSNLPTALSAPVSLGTCRTNIIGDSQSEPTPTSVAAKIAGVQLDHFLYWHARYLHPYEIMRDYGRDLAQDWGDALTMAILDTADVGDTTELIQKIVQIGIDLYGVYEAGGSWGADGCHNLGRKAMIMFAGTVLDIAAMKNLGKSASFHEDDQAYYNDDDDPMWRIRVGKEDNSVWDSGGGYQRDNCQTWQAHALAMLHLGLVTEWGHNAYFDYINVARAGTDTPDVPQRGGANTFQEAVLDDNWSTLYTAASIGPAPSIQIKYTPAGLS